jgi:hypothetical protein
MVNSEYEQTERRSKTARGVISMHSRPIHAPITTVAETIRLDHRDGLFLDLRLSHLRDCPSIFTRASTPRLLRWQYPLSGFLGDSVIAPFEELPRFTSGRWTHYNVKKCGYVPAVESLSLGQPWGLGHDALGFRYLMWSTAQRVLLHLFGCPPSPYAINLPPYSHGVNNQFLR